MASVRPCRLPQERQRLASDLPFLDASAEYQDVNETGSPRTVPIYTDYDETYIQKKQDVVELLDWLRLQEIVRPGVESAEDGVSDGQPTEPHEERRRRDPWRDRLP